MSGGPKYEYLWQDGSKFKKPTKLPANQYISLLMDWIEGQVNDTAIFPLTDDVPFPKNFGSVCKKVRTVLQLKACQPKIPFSPKIESLYSDRHPVSHEV